MKKSMAMLLTLLLVLFGTTAWAQNYHSRRVYRAGKRQQRPGDGRGRGQ